jgi:hypothetical protein
MQTKIFALLFSSLFADSVTVTVSCSNGTFVPNLLIWNVVDSHLQPIPGLTPEDGAKTDEKGAFTIENSETFTDPFYFSFVAKDGSTCGSYSVVLDPIDPSKGIVQLAYYPTSSPCSCANLID